MLNRNVVESKGLTLYLLSEIEAWLAGHGGERSEGSCNKSIGMPAPPNSSKGTSYLIGSVTQSYCEEADGDLYCLGAPSGFCAEPDNP